MLTWEEFRSAAPDLAVAGERLLDRGGVGQALLATVRGDDPPRIHPIWVAIVEGRLYAFILSSAKRRDLEVDGRYALHSHPDPAAPSEFALRGWAHPLDDAAVRSAIAARWYFETDDSYRLFEFSIEAALLGARSGPNEWPPRYSSWAASPGAPAQAPAPG